QRIIPVLRRHFPRMQIFCSTHSPLMLIGLQPGQIHMLQRDSQGTVTVSRNAAAIVSRSADALLEQFFGIPAATSEPAEEGPEGPAPTQWRQGPEGPVPARQASVAGQGETGGSEASTTIDGTHAPTQSRQTPTPSPNRRGARQRTQPQDTATRSRTPRTESRRRS